MPARTIKQQQKQRSEQLVATCREKFALGSERLRAGEHALALLSLHGALEDGLRAYLVTAASSEAEDWPALIAALQADAQRPLSTQQAERLRRTNMLRNRVAHGENGAVTAELVTTYQQFATQLLANYGVALQPPPVAPRRATARKPARRRAVSPPARHRLVELAVRYQQVLVPAAAVLLMLTAGWLVTAALLLAEPQPATQAGRVATSTTGAYPYPLNGPLILPGDPLPTDGAQAAEPDLATGGLTVGGRAVVRVEGQELNVRALPGDGAVIAVLPAGTEVVVLEGPTESAERIWWRVQAGTVQGWCAGEFLQAQAAP